MGPCARQRPPDFFSQKNCALHYAEMLEKVGTPKRKRTNDSSGAETPGKQIVTKLTLEHIDELKNSLKQDHSAYREMKNMIEEIKSGKYDAQLPVLWEKLKNKRRHNEEGQLKLALGTSDTEMPFPNAPLTPTTPVTPTALSAGVLKQGTPSSVAATHQRGKQQRVPKPTPRFQKYQQQLQQQRQSHTPQHHPQGVQGAEGVAMEGDPFKQDQADYFLGDGRSSISIGEHVDVEMTSTSQSGSEGATPTITQSPLQKTFGETGQSIGKQLSSRRTSSVSSNTQSPADAPVLSALLAAPSKDSKKGPDQDSLQKLDRGSSSSPTQVLGQGVQPGSPQLLASNSAQWTNQGGQLASHLPNTQFLEGKPFLGVTSSTMEGKKLDSIRERLNSGSSITAGGTPAVVAAPTLSKLLTTSTAVSPNSGSCHTVTKPTVTVQHTLQTPKVSNNLPGGGGAVISVGGSEASDIQAVPHISVNPKTALNSTLPSSMAITPPPVTPPAEQKNPKRLIVNLQNMLANENMVASSENENDSTTEVVTVKRESEAAPGSSIEHPAVLELKLEASADTPTPSPRIGTRGRAPKPGRPGRPPKGARKSQRRRTKSATSTDNETELEEERDEDTKSESLDVESEKASEKTEDEEDLDFPPGEKKVESDFDEQTSIDDGLSEAGDRSQAERDDPTVSFRDLLNERGSIAGSESVPASPASQISQSDDHEAVQSQKTWKKSIMLVWRAAANHKYANVFNHPVTDDEAPGYHSIVFRPMDLSTIKKNIENGSIRTTSEFQRDMMLMFQNALMYNSADHDVYHMAGEMRDDVMDQIQSYIATQIMVQTSDRESKMLRGHKSDVFHFFL